MSTDFRESSVAALRAAKPLIEDVAAWPDVNAEAYAVVVFLKGELIADMEVSALSKEQWRAPYDQLARAKAALSYRTSLPSRTVLQDRQELLEAGDPRWFGSVVLPEIGLVVAASGGPEDADEHIAATVLGLIRLPEVLRARKAVAERGRQTMTFG